MLIKTPSGAAGAVLNLGLLTTAITLGCGDKTESNTVAADAGQQAGQDAAPMADAAAPAEQLTVDRWGGRLFGQALALTLIDRELYIGTSQVNDNSVTPTTARAGFARLGLAGGTRAAGDLAIWESELPQVSLSAEDPIGAVATGQVVKDGERRLISSLLGIIEKSDDDFILHELVVSGGVKAVPRYIAIDKDGGRNNLWVSTDLGLLRIDPTSFEILERFGNTALGGQSTGSMAIDDATGAVYVAVFNDIESSVVLLNAGEVVSRLTPGDRDVPGGRIRDVVFDAERGHPWIAIAGYDREAAGGVVGWDGTGVQTLATGDELAVAATGRVSAFGASALVVDNFDDVLIVGGQMTPTGPASSPIGGGLVWIDLAAADGELHAFGITTGNSSIVGDHVSALAYDHETDRTYASLMQPCSETRLGNAGLQAVTFNEGLPHFELPILSGVRDIDELDGATVLTLRNDVSGTRCQGVQNHAAIVNIASDRTGAAPSFGRMPEGFDSFRFGASEIAVQGGSVLLAGFPHEVIVNGAPLSPATDLGVSLHIEEAVWASDDTFWIGGEANHGAGDGVEMANVGPRGVSKIFIDENGRMSSTHFVLDVRSPVDGTVTGLPSSHVYAVVPAGTGTYVVTGTERVSSNQYDRQQGSPFSMDGEVRIGGVAYINDLDEVTILDDGTMIPDGRAATLDDDGTLHVLDAENGLLRLENGVFVSVALAITPPLGSIPTSLWMGTDGDMVATYSTGAMVQLDGVTGFVDGVGYAWASRERSDGVVLIGSDSGLLRVSAPGKSDVTESAPIAGEVAPYAIVVAEPGTGGECLPEASACTGAELPCCTGFVCGGSGFVQQCVPN